LFHYVRFKKWKKNLKGLKRWKNSA